MLLVGHGEEICDIMFGCKFVSFFGYTVGMKLRPLPRTDFSVSKSGRFPGIKTAAFCCWFSRGATLFF